MAKTEDEGARVGGDEALRESLSDARANVDEARANLKHAVRELRTAKRRVRGAKVHTGRNTALFATGIVLTVLFNPATGPSTRRWLSTRLWGGETPNVGAAED